MDWAGFSDTDLRKIKQGKKGEDASHRVPPKKPQASPTAVQRKPNQPPKRSAVGATKQRSPPVEGSNILPAEQMPWMLTKKQESEKQKDEQTEVSQPESPQTGTGAATTNNPPCNTNTGSHGHSPDGTVNQSADGANQEELIDLVDGDEEIYKHEVTNMESFQKQQKMMEELNKQKQKLLTSAIKERAKKAKAESTKLIELQRELGKLDQLLTIDVSIIRDKIETASREYLDAHKRYDRAEKEFIESKIDLHKKMDVKEQLTEHLYTVIYQNELRKSKKLAELMRKLEMEVEEVPDIPECDMPHPSLISPVQIPAGRYGQIGPVKIVTPPTSPDSLTVIAGLTKESTDNKTVSDLSDSTKVSTNESQVKIADDKKTEGNTSEKKKETENKSEISTEGIETQINSDKTNSENHDNNITLKEVTDKQSETEGTEKSPKDVNENSTAETGRACVQT